MADDPIQGRRVLVAGATGGIGEGACRELLRRGAELVAVGRSAARLDDLAARLPTAGNRLTLLVADVTAPDGDPSKSGLAETVGTLDGVLVAIGSAGQPAAGTVLDIPETAARAMIETNEIGGLRALRALVPLVRPGGAVVNILGYSAEIPFPSNPLMASTNAAMRSLLMTLAQQLHGTGPRIYGLIVGLVRTRARQAAGIDNPAWLTGDQLGSYTADLVNAQIPHPELPLRYLLDPASGPSTTPPSK